jgi:hypothetical protein
MRISQGNLGMELEPSNHSYMFSKRVNEISVSFATLPSSMPPYHAKPKLELEGLLPSREGTTLYISSINSEPKMRYSFGRICAY